MGRGHERLPAVRHHRTAALGAAILFALGPLSGCAVWEGIGRWHGDAMPSVLGPEAAAWVAAETVRCRFRSADPMPRHAWPPVEVRGDRAYRVLVAKSSRGSYRVAMHGRMSPPRLDGEQPLATLSGSTFHRSATGTGIARGAIDRVRVDIVATDDGCELMVRVDGAADGADIRRRLRSALQLAEAVERTGQQLSGDRATAAESAARAVLDLDDGFAEAPHTLLRSRLRLHLALAQLHGGDAGAARESATLALLDDPRHHAARLLRAQLDARSARTSDLTRQLRMLAQLPGAEPIGRVAGRELPRALQSAENPAAQRALARAWLERGQAGAAHAWIEVALRNGLREPESLDLLARSLRGQGNLRAAREITLLDLASHGFRPELVLALADDSAMLGEPEASLRWLARYWDDIGPEHRAQASTRLAAAADTVGAETTERVLRTEGFGAG